MLTGEPLKD